jgi:hypothetical protein
MVGTLKPVPDTTVDADVQAAICVERAAGLLDDARRDLARVYADAPSPSTAEHEIGECLTKVRAALVRLRKARGELAQMALPLE